MNGENSVLVEMPVAPGKAQWPMFMFPGKGKLEERKDEQTVSNLLFAKYRFLTFIMTNI